MSALLSHLWLIVRQRLTLHDDRGDVPGWVLVTLMTAGIVMALWIVAEPAMSSLLGSALDVAGDPTGPRERGRRRIGCGRLASRRHVGDAALSRRPEARNRPPR